MVVGINKRHHGDGAVESEPPVGRSVLLPTVVGGSFSRRLADRLVSEVANKSETSPTETGTMQIISHLHHPFYYFTRL